MLSNTLTRVIHIDNAVSSRIVPRLSRKSDRFTKQENFAISPQTECLLQFLCGGGRLLGVPPSCNIKNYNVRGIKFRAVRVPYVPGRIVLDNTRGMPGAARHLNRFCLTTE